MQALHGVAERSLSWASIEAHRWTERSATSESTVVDVRAAQTHSRWARCLANDFLAFLELLGATRVQRLQVSRSAGAVDMLEHGNVQKNCVF